MRRLAVLMAALAMFGGAVSASEITDATIAHLYAGTAAEGLAAAQISCDQDHSDGCFGLGLLRLVNAYEGLARDFYRHGAVLPGETPASVLFGLGALGDAPPANPAPEPLTYQGLRGVLDRFVAELDTARTAFEQAGLAGDYVIAIDPLQVRIDLDGDGAVREGENLGEVLAQWETAAAAPPLDMPPVKDKGKTAPELLDTTIGFDRADGIWFAGYSQIAAAPFDLLLAHDFSAFFDAYMHLVFPKAGLPMQDFGSGGVLFLDPAGDAGIADMIASVHTLNFPVADAPRLAGVLDRLKSITALSRRNWELILAETDDNRELVPSPSQTPLVPDMPVTGEIVEAWLATLDTVDQVLDGELLVPHWRFRQGFDLEQYFTTAERTDLILLLTGSGALPYLKDGPVADAQSFAQANTALGADWLNYAFWFN